MLLHELLIVLIVLVALAVAWNLLRAAQLRRAVAEDGGAANEGLIDATPEPLARRVLRIGFGLLWVFDGILQAQSAMPVGLATQVIQPTASSSPTWIQHLVNAGVLIWNNHPVQAAAAAVWVQVGIGIWLLVAPRGRWSQAGAIVSIGWGLVVWSFGEAFGETFAPGLTFLFGAPGAAVIYCFASGLVALPERVWSRRLTGRLLLGAIGIFLLGMALLQAWPGRGFWQGRVRGPVPGTLVGMVEAMVRTPQPTYLSGWVSSFGTFDAAHGFAVNVFAVVVLAAVGLAFCWGRPRLVRIALYLGCLFCLADWVLIEDLGFFGGLGTDPNSMIPVVLLFVAGYLALFRRPVVVQTTQPTENAHLAWAARARANPSYAFRLLAAGGAAMITLLGVVPLAIASVNPNADPIAINVTSDKPITALPGA